MFLRDFDAKMNGQVLHCRVVEAPCPTCAKTTTQRRMQIEGDYITSFTCSECGVERREKQVN